MIKLLIELHKFLQRVRFLPWNFYGTIHLNNKYNHNFSSSWAQNDKIVTKLKQILFLS